jgi:hypothetical protein
MRSTFSWVVFEIQGNCSNQILKCKIKYFVHKSSKQKSSIIGHGLSHEKKKLWTKCFEMIIPIKNNKISFFTVYFVTHGEVPNQTQWPNLGQRKKPFLK